MLQAKNTAAQVDYLDLAEQTIPHLTAEILMGQNAEQSALGEQILQQYGISIYNETTTSIRKNAMACVALPTCPLALAEAQRYLPSLISKIEPILAAMPMQIVVTGELIICMVS